MPIASQQEAQLIVVSQGLSWQTATILRAVHGHARGGKYYG